MTEQEQIAERIRLRFEKMRAEREAYWASRTEQDLLRMRIAASEDDVPPLMRMFLATSVPMWMHEARFWRPEVREQKAHELVEILAFDQGVAALCDPDAARWSQRHSPGEMSRAFNAVAQGLALLSFCPGGVVFAGHHWEASP